MFCFLSDTSSWTELFTRNLGTCIISFVHKYPPETTLDYSVQNNILNIVFARWHSQCAFIIFIYARGNLMFMKCFIALHVHIYPVK